MFTINCKGTLLSLQKPVVMGILNINRDSFYPGSRKPEVKQALQTAGKMLSEGAAILDIGGQSTRPQSIRISAQEEIKRVIPVLSEIKNRFPGSILSIDTFYAKVARVAVEAGASIVNDISAGNLDTEMIATVGELGTPFIAMHTKGTPQNMNTLCQYGNITREVTDYFIEKINICQAAGIKDLILDPGFGFAKNAGQSFELLKNLSVLSLLEKPVMAGLSRKSMIYKTLNTTPEQALNGTTVLNTIALQNGANMLRVHDVVAAMETIALVEKMK